MTRVFLRSSVAVADQAEAGRCARLGGTRGRLRAFFTARDARDAAGSADTAERR